MLNLLCTKLSRQVDCHLWYTAHRAPETFNYDRVYMISVYIGQVLISLKHTVPYKNSRFFISSLRMGLIIDKWQTNKPK